MSWNRPLRRKRSWKVYVAGALIGAAMWVGLIYGAAHLFH